LIRKYDRLPFLTYKRNSRQEIYSRRPHSHDEVSLGYIESGRTTITVGKQKYLLTEGDLVLIPSRTVHICIPEDLSCFRFRMYYLNEGWWIKNFPVSPDTFRTLAIPAPDSFMRMLGEGGADKSEMQEEELVNAIQEIIMKYNLQDIKTHPGESEIEAVHQLIREMPQASLSIDSLATKAGFNKYSFIRQYSGRYGLTPHADIVNMRIQRAILLFETDMDLVDIALSCGFSDQSHFIKQFKLYCGLRPMEYRNGIRRISAGPQNPGD